MLSEALAWRDHAYDVSKQKQMFLYVEDKDEINKSQIIKIIIANMNLIFWKDEIILMMLIEAAIDNIDENIYHITLNINLVKKQNLTVSSHIRKLWSNKIIMIINEISMMNLNMLSKINNQCKIIKFLNRSSSDLFDELLTIIFMRDFY